MVRVSTRARVAAAAAAAAARRIFLFASQALPRPHAFSPPTFSRRPSVASPSPDVTSTPPPPAIGSRSIHRFQASAAASKASFLGGVEPSPPDPILGVSVAFRACDDPNKLNLGVGAYRTEELQPYVLEVVREAERRMIAAGHDKEYLPMQGLAEFCGATAELLLGKGHPAIAEKRVARYRCVLYTGPHTTPSPW